MAVAILIMVAGGIGMAMALLLVAANSPPSDRIVGTGLIAGSVLIGSGLISLALLASAKARQCAQDNA
jgi:hypothetical protein